MKDIINYAIWWDRGLFGYLSILEWFSISFERNEFRQPDYLEDDSYISFCVLFGKKGFGKEWHY